MKQNMKKRSIVSLAGICQLAQTLLLIVLFTTLQNCKGGSKNARVSSDDTDVDESSSQSPVAVTGSNLLDADTAAISYQVASSGSKKQVSAYAMYRDPTTGELKDADGLASGYSIQWGSFTDASGKAVSGAVCGEVAANDLKMDCEYSGSAISFKLGFAIADGQGKQTQVGTETIVPAVSSATLSLVGSTLTLNIAGADFPDAPAITVGTSSCTNSTRVSSSLITCELPAGLGNGEYDVAIVFASVVMKAEKVFSQGPTSLSSYSGVTGSSAGDINVSWTLPSDISAYSTFKVMRSSGATPPTDCSTGTQAATRSSFTASASDSFTDALVAGSYYSYRFCIADAAGRTTSINTISNVQAKTSSGGASDVYMFITSNTISNMNMSGTSGADSQCATRGALGPVSSMVGVFTWRAVVASSTQSARARMGLSSSVIVKDLSGTILATSEAQLWNDSSFTLNAALTLNENGGISSGSVAVGSTANNCSDWSSNSGAFNFVAGLSSATNSDWWLKLAPACNGGAYLYCYGVPGQ